jgi:hypothetical protein
LILAYLLMLSGCGTAWVGITPVPSDPRHWVDVRLHVGETNTTGAGFVLVFVDENLKTVILLDSGRALSGKPGDRFEVPLGCSCPRLIWACHETGEARFR